MPRLRQSVTDVTGRLLTSAAMRRGYSLKQLVSECGFSESTLYKRKREPETMTLKELRSIIRVLDLTDTEIAELAKGVWG